MVKRVRIDLDRYAYAPTATMGVLTFNRLKLHTIEAPWLENAINISCIPEGLYKCRRVNSPKYGDCFEIIVPNRTHILLHPANWARSLAGCIALGLSAHSVEYKVNSSRIACKSFMEALSTVDEFDLSITQFKPSYKT